MSEINEQIKALKSEIDERIKTLAPEATKGQIEDLSVKLNDFKELVGKSDTEKQKQLDALEIEVKKLRDNGMEATKSYETTLQGVLLKGIEDNKEDFDSFKNTRSKNFALDNVRVKTVGNMTFSASTTGQVVDNSYLPILPEVERRQRIRGLLRVGVSGGQAIEFPKVTGGEGNAANQTEGNAKSQIDKDFELQSYPFRTIAGFARISTQMMDDLQGLTSYLAYELPRKLYNQEDTQLLSGDGIGTNLYGLENGAKTAADVPATFTAGTAPSHWDAILAAMAAVDGADYKADTILVNPVDFYELAASKGSNGQYKHPAVALMDGRVSFFGYPISMSTAVTAGEFYVFDSQSVGMLFQRQAPNIRFFEQDSDNAQKNLITVRVEERLTLAKLHADACFFSTFDEVITAITGS